MNQSRSQCLKYDIVYYINRNGITDVAYGKWHQFWNCMDRNGCLELALEGERLCKSGDFRGGVAFFEAAISVGTDDLKTLSAIYSQLGNAYFYLGDYAKAMDYHKCDLTVARAIKDELGEGKASGNLGNTLKVMGKYDEAVACCERHLNISRKLQDKVGEGRALYNLGNVYHAKGKRFACLGHQDPGEFPEEVKACLQKAVLFYEESLKIMTELGDRSAQGRACGNLGNTHYLLGNFSEAITYHQERLKIAKEYGDWAAERRAHNNLGNAHIFLGEFEVAAEHYKKTLSLAVELRDKAVEAQACYSLGNTYTLLHDYPTAIEYHLRHLKIAQELRDKIGEGRAYWSLGNAHSAIGNHEQALHYANRHLEISKEIGDQSGEITAQLSIADLKKVLDPHDSSYDAKLSSSLNVSNVSMGSNGRMRRVSMEHMDLLKLTPDAKVAKASADNSDKLPPVAEVSPTENNSLNINHLPVVQENPKMLLKEQNDLENSIDEESFFDLLSRFQSKRMDDQRCSLALLENKENNQLLGNHPPSSLSSSVNNVSPGLSDKENGSSVRDDLFDLIAGMQSRRLDEQRASLPRLLPGQNFSSHCNSTNRNNNNNAVGHGHVLRQSSPEASSLPDDDFFDMLMRCQATRIEDQRSSMPDLNSQATRGQHSYSPTSACSTSGVQSAPTVPDEDFFSLIMRFQAGRIDDQRSFLPGKVNSVSKDGVDSTSETQKGSGHSSRTSSIRSSLKTISMRGSSKH